MLHDIVMGLDAYLTDFGMVAATVVAIWVGWVVLRLCRTAAKPRSDLARQGDSPLTRRYHAPGPRAGRM